MISDSTAERSGRPVDTGTRVRNNMDDADALAMLKAGCNPAVPSAGRDSAVSMGRPLRTRARAGTADFDFDDTTSPAEAAAELKLSEITKSLKIDDAVPSKSLKGKGTIGRFRSIDPAVHGQYTGWLLKVRQSLASSAGSPASWSRLTRLHSSVLAACYIVITNGCVRRWNTQRTRTLCGSPMSVLARFYAVWRSGWQKGGQAKIFCSR